MYDLLVLLVADLPLRLSRLDAFCHHGVLMQQPLYFAAGGGIRPARDIVKRPGTSLNSTIHDHAFTTVEDAGDGFKDPEIHAHPISMPQGEG